MNVECIQTLLGHSSYIYSVCISKDGKNIISGSADSSIKICSKIYDY